MTEIGTVPVQVPRVRDRGANEDGVNPVIPPFLMGLSRRIHAAVFSFMAGVIPPIAMLGRSLLYVQSHFVA